MPDPHRDLAPIIEPVAPPPLPEDHGLALALGLALAGIAIAAGLAWWWRRRRPLRALRQLAIRAESGMGEARDLADRLAALLCRRHRLARLEARQCPAALSGQEATWSEWVVALETIRFGPPGPVQHAELARLCREARALLKPGR